jgi:hypothetical protein
MVHARSKRFPGQDLPLALSAFDIGPRDHSVGPFHGSPSGMVRAGPA